MLLRFCVENHRSIRDAQELLLTASERIKPEDRRGTVLPVPGTQEAALPAVALYGSNASGKSGVLEALGWMSGLVVNSHTEMKPVSLILQQPFLLDLDSSTKPTRLECTFTLSHEKELSSSGQATEEVQPVYTYGFKYTQKGICEEWLYQEVTEENQDNQLLFRRTTVNQKIDLKIGSQLSGENEIIKKLTRPNSLFLSAAAQNNHPQLLVIYKYFLKMMFLKDPESVREHLIADRFSKLKNQETLKDILQQADIGITDIVVKELDLPEDQTKIMRDLSEIIPQIISKHISFPFEAKVTSPGSMPAKHLGFIHSTADGEPRTLGYDLESRGTQVFLTLLLPALEALSEGSLLVIDELDTSLHPDLSRAFLSLFHRKASNPHGAQLLFSTHDITLLDSHTLEQDEIWFTDKDPDGASRLTPLTDFKLPDQLRHDDIEQAYRLGRFGGVPNSREFLVELNADQGEKK
ncbi:MAG: ATP-binding protein [Cyanobacteria bacterium MAG CAR4_bin_6]|nr:ATP-binding protein [Cyanobacteria bacterium MAG CAR4_bin_6]